MKAKCISIGNKYYAFTDEEQLKAAMAMLPAGHIAPPFEVLVDELPTIKGYTYSAYFNSYSQPRVIRAPDARNNTLFPTVEDILAYVEEHYGSVLGAKELETLYAKRGLTFKKGADTYTFSIYAKF